ncbi:MAG: putative acyl-CoA thioester hydrolase [uncultured marine phage]|uniref:Putative acyl-CoA thioester hydrolase n=1 Tax=uncultured marine phage TaxID=707152 RepID=A0A8D9CF25_9VIRU|nr:MAG: putative acyl-CoA thioester hydrolase [uncultured marine phage]
MELISTFVCMTKDLGIHNNLFGGILLSKLDESGVVLVTQICDTPRMVTLKMDEVTFKKPVKVGNLIKIYGEPVDIGRSSITVKIEARKHNVYTGKEKLVCSTKMVFVRIDEDGESVPISERVKKKFGFS